jgi:hypothetical protein
MIMRSKMSLKTLINNMDNLKAALKIQADREYRQLVEKAINLGVDDFNYGSYDPQGLRHAIGEKLHETSAREQRFLHIEFYNTNSRGC